MKNIMIICIVIFNLVIINNIFPAPEDPVEITNLREIPLINNELLNTLKSIQTVDNLKEKMRHILYLQKKIMNIFFNSIKNVLTKSVDIQMAFYGYNKLMKQENAPILKEIIKERKRIAKIPGAMEEIHKIRVSVEINNEINQLVRDIQKVYKQLENNVNRRRQR